MGRPGDGLPAERDAMAVSRVPTPFVARVAIANPLQVKAIAHAHARTDKACAGTLASLHAAGCLPGIRTPDAATERLRRLVARRCQIVRHRTRLKNEVHSILSAHLIPKCPHADLPNQRGRAWLARQPMPDDERVAIERHVRELDRLGEDLAELDHEIALSVMDDASVRRLMTITGVNLTVASGIMAAIGDISRFESPSRLVSYFGLNPRVRQSGLGAAHHGRIEPRWAAATPARCWSRARRSGGPSGGRTARRTGGGQGPRAFARLLRARPGEEGPPDRRGGAREKLTVLRWHLLTKEQDHLWARPALVAKKARDMELQAGRPQKKGDRRGPAYARQP